MRRRKGIAQEMKSRLINLTAGARQGGSYRYVFCHATMPFCQQHLKTLQAMSRMKQTKLTDGTMKDICDFVIEYINSEFRCVGASNLTSWRRASGRVW